METEETRRLEHVKKYGSFLYCPERDTLCAYQEENVRKGTECAREPCILDDPGYIELKKIIERNRTAASQNRSTQEDAAPIRRQNKSRQDQLREEIQRLEREARLAYRRNRPKIGEQKQYKAMMLERELRGLMEK